MIVYDLYFGLLSVSEILVGHWDCDLGIPSIQR